MVLPAPTTLSRWVIAFVLVFGAPRAHRVLAVADGAPPPFALEALRPLDRHPARTGFTPMEPARVGITFTNHLDEERSLANQILLNGSGVAAGDVDGDGWPDLYFCAIDGTNALYRNRGDGRFEDRTSAAGVGCAGQASTGTALADLDGDGDLDLLVNGLFRGTRLFLNDGRGKFTEATDTAGLRSGAGAASLAIADYDGDGLLDLYAVHYRSVTMRDQPGIAFTVGITNGVRRLLTVDGRPADAPDLRGRFSFTGGDAILENGEADVLYRNLGGGRFARVPWDGSVFREADGKPSPEPFDWGLSAQFHDLNGDGAPELYVCNDFQSPDRLWINDGQGHFMAAPRGTLAQTSLFSMGADVADLDRDGHSDFFVADMLSREHVRRQVQVMNAAAARQSRLPGPYPPQFSRNTLYRNRGDGTFAELARFAGVEASDWTWCPVFLDVDLDGYEDLLVTTGHGRDAQDADAAREIDASIEQRRLTAREQLRARRRFPRLETPNFAFRNRGAFRFEETGASWGFDARRISQGMALADLDLDGDLDVVITTLGDAPLLLRNDSHAPRLAVLLAGRAGNTRGIGARIDVEVPGLPVQSQELLAGGRYLSSDDALRVFAMGHTSAMARVTVRWRAGGTTVVTNAPANRRLLVREPEASTGRPASPPNPPTRVPADGPLFEDRSRILGHQQVDQVFDDFSRQPLLPRSLSQPGPAVAWFDFNGDGWEDLLVGAGRGGRLAAFRNDGQGGFIPQRAQMFTQPFERDLTGLLLWRPAPDQLLLAAGLDAYETEPAPVAPAVRVISLVQGSTKELRLDGASSPGPLALGDLDGDGDLDVFVGGRVIPGRFPEPADSHLLLSDGGRLTTPAQRPPLLRQLGLVQSAVFTDLTGDARPELVVAPEWGALRILRWEGSDVREWVPELEWTETAGRSPSQTPRLLPAMTGLWNSVTAGDFDGDGRMDLVAGNLGLNHAHRGHLQQPLRLAFAPQDDAGHLGVIEARFDAGVGAMVPYRDRNDLTTAFPGLALAFPTFASFARAHLTTLLAANLPPAGEVHAALTESVVLLNRGDRFMVRPLPDAAQMSPIFGLGAADFDGDGQVDLVASQNQLSTSAAESPLDAGQGLLLRGDGQGGFTPLSAEVSGLRIEGEGRGLAVCDFDHDGRPDLVAAQNRGVTRLLRNAGGRPGLRVVLRGKPGNPQAIGARVRLEFPGGRLGPAHEIHAGAGYWGQDAATVVPGTPEEPVAVEVRWPDGTVRRVPILAADFEKVIEYRAP